MALVLIDYQNEMFEVIRSETPAEHIPYVPLPLTSVGYVR